MSLEVVVPKSMATCMGKRSNASASVGKKVDAPVSMAMTVTLALLVVSKCAQGCLQQE